MAFSGSQGNKMERLQKVQQDLAKNRYQQNMDRLNQTRQFANQLTNQAMNARGQMQGFDTDKINLEMNKANMAKDWIQRNQNQANAAFGQRQDSAHQTDFSAGLNGAIAGGMQGAQMGGGGMGGGAGGMSGASGGGMNSMFSGSPKYIA
jgi:hypothetical protein